jgi:hypothetical protein
MGNNFNAKRRILVPKDEGYEIENGLPNMKRDINLKLVAFLNDDKIKQVFFILFFSVYIFLVICNKL